MESGGSTISSPGTVVTSWLSSFNKAIEDGNIEALQATFSEKCFWRDLVAMTWNIKTIEGREAIGDMARSVLKHTLPTNWEVEGEAAEANGLVEAKLRFETTTFKCVGHVRLAGEQALTLFTAADALKGFEEQSRSTRPVGVNHGVHKGRQSWTDVREKDRNELGYSKQPYVLIIGGGQCGIALGARLRMLNVPTIILEKKERAGDSWRSRYKSLCLHDPVWYDHLPYIPFPEHWPIFTPKDKMGDWLECYVKLMELNYWSSSVCTAARFDEATELWEVDVTRAGEGGGERLTLKPKQLVFAMGMTALPNIPNLPGSDAFTGEIQHSSQHPGPDAYTGKKVVVVGSNNSAHDVSAALWEAGAAEVTMVQRSSTHISTSKSILESLAGVYSQQAAESGITVEKADLFYASVPYAMLPDLMKQATANQKLQDADFYERLRKVGFKLDFGEDETGLFMKFLRRNSGYYIDVGASNLVADGSIKLAHGQVTEFTPTALKVTDGDNVSELTADLVVFATGYKPMNHFVHTLVNPETAYKVGRCWGLGSGLDGDVGPWEGELRNMWKPTQQKALWFHGGNLALSRTYSKYLALQLKARFEQIPTPVYGLQEVHHHDC